MERDISFNLITETTTKDANAQSIVTKKSVPCIGRETSTYQNEFFQASQAGMRPQGVIKMNLAEYGGQKLLSINGQEYSIYRTFTPDLDWIELYFGERVGNG